MRSNDENSGRSKIDAQRRNARRDLFVGAFTAALCVLIQALHLRFRPTSLPQVFMLLERLLCAGLIGFLFMVLAFRAARALRAHRFGRRDLVVLGLLSAALAVRWILPPILLHVEFVGLKYVGMSMDLTSVFHQDGTYGQAGFLTQGLLAHALGGSIRALVMGNALISVAAMGIAAALLLRWTRSDLLACAAFLLMAGFNPLLVRTGASEDVHVIGAFYAFLSLYLLELYCDRGRIEDLLTAASACILAACSRQFFLPMPVLFFLYFVERRRLAEAFRWPALSGFTLLLAGAVIKWSVLLFGLLVGLKGAQFGSAGPFSNMLDGFCIMASLAFKEPHPLLQQTLLPLPLALFLALGLYRIARWKDAPRSVLLAWCYLFVLSLATPMPGIQIGYLFRIPFLFLTVLVGGLGFHAALVFLKEKRPSRRLAAAFFTLAIALPVALSIPRIVKESVQDPFTRQALFIESVMTRLPDSFVIVKLSRGDIEDDNLYFGLPDFLWMRHNKRVSVISLRAFRKDPPRTSDPVYLFTGVECRSISVFETRAGWKNPISIVSRSSRREFLELIFPKRPDDATILEKRRICFSDPRMRLEPSPLTLAVDPRGFTPTNLFYVEKPFLIGFRRLF